MNCSIIAAENGKMTLREIGEILGLTRMRICQIEKRALLKIKDSLMEHVSHTIPTENK
jgi:DNA-directed RNA polymerase sigma subunit (sigma70/sigma32)